MCGCWVCVQDRQMWLIWTRETSPKLNAKVAYMLLYAHTCTHTHPLTTTKFASSIHRIHHFSPLYQALQVLLMCFWDVPLSHTRGDEYSCVQQLASTTLHTAIICMAAIKETRMCVSVCVWHCKTGTKWARMAAVASNSVRTFYLFGYETKRRNDLMMGSLDWAKTPCDDFILWQFLHKQEMLQKVSVDWGWHCSKWSFSYFIVKRKLLWPIIST